MVCGSHTLNKMMVVNNRPLLEPQMSDNITVMLFDKCCHVKVTTHPTCSGTVVETSKLKIAFIGEVDAFA